MTGKNHFPRVAVFFLTCGSKIFTKNFCFAKTFVSLWHQHQKQLKINAYEQNFTLFACSPFGLDL